MLARDSRLAALLLPCWLAACSDLASIDQPDLESLDETERKRVELGRDLFFDAGLSAEGDLACASCHLPTEFGADGLAQSQGFGGQTLRRNAPSAFNAALKAKQFWDGRAETLEEQALGPLLAAEEMGQTEAGALDVLERGYADAFAEAFPGESGPTLEQFAVAIASYERMLPARSDFDEFIDGDRGVYDQSELRGYRLFRDRCARCHGGAGVGGQDFELLGEDIAWPEDRREDQGLYEVTGRAEDKMFFLVPSLRNVAETGPYFHDGSVETLEDAVRLMVRHQLGATFTDRQVDDLVNFLETLTANDVPDWAFPQH